MKTLEPFLSVRAVQPVVAALEALGHPVDGMLDEAGIPRSVLQDADGLLKQSPRQPTIAARLRAWLDQELSSGVPTAGSAARAFHMSVRTLHRSLRNEGTTLGELLDTLRRERAATLLANPRCSVAEAGFLLGFADLSSFSRAFKRWTAKTPAEFRAETFAALRYDPPQSRR